MLETTLAATAPMMIPAKTPRITSLRSSPTISPMTAPMPAMIGTAFVRLHITQSSGELVRHLSMGWAPQALSAVPEEIVWSRIGRIEMRMAPIPSTARDSTNDASTLDA